MNFGEWPCGNAPVAASFFFFAGGEQFAKRPAFAGSDIAQRKFVAPSPAICRQRS